MEVYIEHLPEDSLAVFKGIFSLDFITTDSEIFDEKKIILTLPALYRHCCQQSISLNIRAFRQKNVVLF